MEALLSKLYYDPKTGFISARKLYEKAKDLDSSIRLKDVKIWYLTQLEIQRFQDQRTTLPQFKITSHNPNSWQMDLMFWTKKTILTAININSRIGYATLLPDKTAASVLKGFENLVKMYPVDIITSDNGREFMNDTIQKYLKIKQIEHFNNEAGDHNTMGKIERYNRTLKQRLTRIDRPLNQKLLTDVVSNYNTTFHSSIDATPNSMKGKVMENEIYHNQQVTTNVMVDLNIGDSVIYKLKKQTFGKESVKWSKTIYKIVGMDGYKIQIRSKNSHTLYKPHGELKIVEGEATDAPIAKNQIWEIEKILEHKSSTKGKNKYLVKWVGYDEPTWELQDNLRLINKNKMSTAETVYFTGRGD